MHPFVQYRHKHNLTQVELAGLIGVSSTYIHMIEKGLREPSKKLCAIVEQKTDGEIPRLILLYPGEKTERAPARKGCDAPRGRSLAKVPAKAQSR